MAPSTDLGFSTSPDYAPQNMTISSGLARFSALNRGSIYEGYVTPQGALEMRNGLGARLVGQIGSDNVARGRIIGTCVYELTWRKSALAVFTPAPKQPLSFDLVVIGCGRADSG